MSNVLRDTCLAMKKLFAPLVLCFVLAFAATGCLGSYSAMHAVNRWNSHATGSKIANSVIHFGLWVIPVYPLALAGDFLIFNNVEFFTGNRMFN